MENARISFFATSLDADNVENVIQIRERERQKLTTVALVINGKKPFNITPRKLVNTRSRDRCLRGHSNNR